MKSSVLLGSAAALALGFAFTAAQAQVLPGDTVADRAVAGAKQYVEQHKLKDPKTTILLNSLFQQAQPAYNERWEKLTGVKVENIPLGYTDIPAKVMAEAVAKTGVYDIFNDLPYTLPDAVGAGTLQVLDPYAAKGKPDFSGIAPGLGGQQYYNGKQYAFI